MAKHKASSESTLEMIETTIGELIEIITEIALESGKSEAEGYQLASATLEHIIRKSQRNYQSTQSH